MTTVYDNKDGESFYRESDTYGHTGKYDVRRATKAELDRWLADHGFEVVGYEK
jgi:hypothetical protein